MQKIDVIKIAISVVVVSLMFFFAYKYVGGKVVKPSDEEFAGKYGDLTTVVDRKIEKTITEANPKDLVETIAAYGKIVAVIDYFFDVPEAMVYKNTCTEKLKMKFMDKFIEQAYYVFEHKDWEKTDIEAIRKNIQLVKAFGLDSDGKIDRLKSIITDYDNVNNYLKQVRNEQTPSSIFITWQDKSNLIKSVYQPQESLVKNNYGECENLTKNYVRGKIQTQHEDFVKELIKKLEAYDFSDQKDWESKAGKVRTELEVFLTQSKNLYESSYDSRKAMENKYSREIDETQPDSY